MWAKGSRRKGGLDSISPLLHLVGLEWKGRDGNVGRVSEDATQGFRFPSLTAELGCERRGRGRRLRGVGIIGTLNGDVIYDLIPEAGGLIDGCMLQRAGVGK